MHKAWDDQRRGLPPCPPCPRPAAFSRCITCSQYHVNYRVIVTIFGFNYALGGGFYLASGLPISSPLHPPSCMPEEEKGKIRAEWENTRLQNRWDPRGY
jgi:hypothetical protein